MFRLTEATGSHVNAIPLMDETKRRAKVWDFGCVFVVVLESPKPDEGRISWWGSRPGTHFHV